MSSNPVTDAFFFGRALAEVVSEKLEESFTNAMSDLGKFDAEQRENLRKFVEEVQLRAEQAAGNSANSTTTYPGNGSNNSATPVETVNFDFTSDRSVDLQAMLDRFRAEVATLRAELKQYRN